MRILVVEDDPINRRILLKFLEPFGKADPAQNGLEASKLFRTAIEGGEPYSLVCLDLAMPIMDGHQTMEEIAKTEAEHNVPEEKRAKILVITSFSDEENILRTYDKCHGYLIKPIKKGKLFEKLNLMGFFCLEPQSPNEPAPEERTQTGEYSEMVPLIREEDGRIQFLVRDADGEYNPRDPSEIEFFKNVLTGQVIARTASPDPAIKYGESVIFSRDRKLFFAKKSGRAVFEDNCLLVQESIVINGDVLFDNISFLGKVTINGDVNDDISINAHGGITINGVAGACELISGGDVRLRRLNGKGRARVKCSGAFYARFVYESLVESQRDIVVETEALESRLKSGAGIRAGSIAGGECVAAGNIEANRIGSANGVRTAIRAGLNFYKAEKLRKLERNIDEINKRLETIRKMIGPSDTDISQSLALPPSAQKKVYALAAEKNHLEGTRERLQEEMGKLREEAVSVEEPSITVNEIIHNGVELTIRNKSETLAEDLKGPLVLDEKYIDI